MHLNKINILYTLSNLLYKYFATKLFCVENFNGGHKVLNFLIFFIVNLNFLILNYLMNFVKFISLL